MLSRIEDVYLNILRIAVLCIATIALLAFAFSLLQSGPMLGRLVGVSTTTEIQNATLSAFVAENREALGAPDSAAAIDASAQVVPQSIEKAAENISAYVAKHHGFTIEMVQARAHLMSFHDAMPLAYQAQYATSIEAMTKQLVDAVGEPLSTENLNRAIAWHADRFQSQIQENELSKAESASKAVVAATVAGMSLLTFLIVIFFFVVVKIERNLRVVRTQNVSGAV